MKKYSALVLVLIMCVGMLSGCGKSYSTEESTVFVLKKGKIVSTDVESFDTSAYSEAALKEYVEQAVAEYTATHGKDSVVLKELTCMDGMATLILEYASAEDYAGFNGIDLYTGSVAEALAAGYRFDSDFAEIGKDSVKECTSSVFMNGEKYKVAIIKANTNLTVPGNICYASSQNVSLVNKNTVAIKSGYNLLGTVAAETETEEVPTETEELVTETEVETSGSVSEDELLLEEETETEIVFEFVEEQEEPVAEDTTQYSSVYTYIIYK